MSDFKRITPEQALEKVNEELQEEKKGRLKIFLGYAPGVGKTYSMLNEANRRALRNEDIVIGFLETHNRKETMAQIGSLTSINRKTIIYNNCIMEELDLDTILKLKPKTVLVDELAHTNVPGSKNKKRYEDVLQILDAGINVITTLNIQHLESLNDVIKKITGIQVKETIPDFIVQNADEVVVIDLTPDALQNRLKRGNIYEQDNADRSLKNFFRKGNLNALREITLRHIAEEVDDDLKEYMEEHGIADNWHTVERVLVCISSSVASKKLIRRGARRAKQYKCELFVVYVDCTSPFAPKTTLSDKHSIENNFKLAKQLGASTKTLSGKSVSSCLCKFATDMHITQIIVGHSNRSKLQTILRGSTINKLLKNTKDIEVHVIPTDN